MNSQPIGVFDSGVGGLSVLRAIRQALALRFEIDPPTMGLMTEAALIREESRGAHFRSDFPQTSAEWQRHITWKK